MSEKRHVFLGNVQHNKQSFLKGQLCPAELHDEMLSKGLIVALPEPVVPAVVAAAEYEPKKYKKKE